MTPIKVEERKGRRRKLEKLLRSLSKEEIKEIERAIGIMRKMEKEEMTTIEVRDLLIVEKLKIWTETGVVNEDSSKKFEENCKGKD